MNSMRRLLSCVLLVAMAFALGCVDAEKINVRLDIDRELQGKVTLEFLGIHSTAGKPEEQKAEMQKFVDSDYKENAERIVREWSLKDAQTELTNKTDSKCDGKIVGEIDTLIKTLSPLVDERGATYEIKRDATRFYFTARVPPDPNASSIDLTITYPGKIVEHNAQSYNEAAHLMQWNLGKINAAGIHFVLDTTP